MFLVKLRHFLFYANYINDLGETGIHFKPHANCINVTGQIGLHLMSHANYILFYTIWIHLTFYTNYINILANVGNTAYVLCQFHIVTFVKFRYDMFCAKYLNIFGQFGTFVLCNLHKYSWSN